MKNIILLLLSIVTSLLFFNLQASLMNDKTWKINTSNPGKFKEFKALFAKFGKDLDATHFDLKEIDADPIKVIAQKASQLEENIIVEDTSLDIDGASIGVNVRWLLDHMSEYVGRKAVWTVLLGVRQGKQVFIYRGTIDGTIVPSRGVAGFGFDAVFMPEGAQNTLAESKPDAFNARAKAVDALIHGNIWTTHPMIENWEGPWQMDEH